MRSTENRAARGGVVMTPRDRIIVEALETIGMLTTRQVQLLAFSLKNDSAAKRRLTRLQRAGLVRRLPRASVNAPYVYYAPRQKPKRALLEHQLGISELYVRVARACAELGFTLRRWLGPSVLQPLLAGRPALAPDAYFQIERVVDGEPKSAGFFLEYERTPRAASVLAHKLARYADLYYSGTYRELFGHRGMRVLVVSAPGNRLGLTRAELFPLTRIASLEAILLASPADLLTGPLWHRPGDHPATALYTDQPTEAR